YCYVPDLDTLDKPTLLAVPDNTGANFTETLRTGMRLLAGNWDGDDSDGDSSDNSSASSGDSSGSSTDASNTNASANGVNGTAASQGASSPSAPADATPDPAAIAQQRGTLVTKIMQVVASAAPDDGARNYVAKLQTALQKLASQGDDLPFSSDDIPSAHVTPTPDALPGAPDGKGAPVVFVSLGQTDLSDALLRANGGVLILAATDSLDTS